MLLDLSSLMLIATGAVGSSEPLYVAATAWLVLALVSALAGIRRQDRLA